MLFGQFEKKLYGRISFEITDGFSELFIDECRKSDTELYNVKADTCGIKAECEEKYLSSVMQCAEKTKCEVHIIERKGLPYFLYRYRKRTGILVGILLSVLMVFLLNGRIWEVKIEGNECITEDEIRKILIDENVKVGALHSSVNFEEVSEHLENKLPGIYWASVNISGTKAVVQLRERTDIPEIEDEKEYSNIVAGTDGQIIRADVYSGVSNVKPGMAVVKGDLLVSGVEELREGNRFIRTEADITARTRSFMTNTCLKNKSVKCLKESKDHYLLYFLGLHFPFDISKKEKILTVNDYSFTSTDTVFPFGYSVMRKTVTENALFEWNKNREVLKCYADMSARFFLRYRNSDIEKFVVEIKNTDRVTVSADCTCVEDITVKRRIYVDDF